MKKKEKKIRKEIQKKLYVQDEVWSVLWNCIVWSISEICVRLFVISHRRGHIIIYHLHHLLGTFSIFHLCIKAHYLMYYMQDILCGISNGTLKFHINILPMHWKIRFYTKLKFSVFLDSRTCEHFWKGPRSRFTVALTGWPNTRWSG